MKKMNPKVKAAWIKDLRSGKYAQTKRYLHVVKGAGDIKPGYCCLGRLCALAPNKLIGVPGQPVLRTENGGTPANCEDITVEVIKDDLLPTAHFPNTKVLKWADLDYDVAQKLAQRNDCGATFLEIANWIEEHL